MIYSEYKTRKLSGKAEIKAVDGTKVIQYKGFDPDTGNPIIADQSSLTDDGVLFLRNQQANSRTEILNLQNEIDSLELLLTDWENYG